MRPELGLVFPSANRRGGVERVALDVLTRLSVRRRVAFIGRSFEPDGPTDVAFHPVARRGSFRNAAATVLAAVRPDVTLSFGVTCPAGDVYWVHSVHESWLRSGSSVRVKGITVPAAARRAMPRHRHLLRLERQYFTQHQPRAILCTSTREAEDLAAIYGVDSELLHVVPNGFDAQRFHAQARAKHREATRAAMRLEDGQISLLFAANELHRKGLAVLLEAVALVGDDRLRVDVVGRTDPAGFAQALGQAVPGCVFYHGATSTIERYYAAADLLVLPTQYEPFGLVIIEALACGLPVVTTSLAGASTAVTESVGRLQLDPLNAEELAALLSQALVHGALELWSAAAPAAARPYEWDAVLQKAEMLIFGGQ